MINNKYDIRTAIIKSRAIFSENHEHRYLLERNWYKDEKDIYNDNNDRKMVFVIMFNPSYADELRYDYTSMKIINYLIDNKDYDGVYILNLYSIQRPKKEDVKNELKTDFNDENDKFIEWALKKSKDIYIAWGSNENNKNRIEEIIKMISYCGHSKVYQLVDKDNNAKHPSRCTIDKEIEIDINNIL